MDTSLSYRYSYNIILSFVTSKQLLHRYRCIRSLRRIKMHKRKSMKLKSLLLFTVMSINSLFSQSGEIKGIIRDAETHEGIPWVTVKLLNTHLGTIANSQGEFLMSVSSFPVTTVISHIGYQTDTVQLTISTSEINLKRKDIVLSEVEIVANDNYAINLIKKVYAKITDGENSIKNGKVFYRQYNMSEANYTQVIEIFFETLINSRGIIESAVEQGKYARAKRQSNDTSLFWDFLNFSNFSTGTFKSNQYKNSFFSFLPFVKRPDFYIPIREDVEDYFDLRTEGFYESEKSKIVLIDFSPKSNLDKPAFSGRIKIDTTSLQIISIEEKVEDDRFKLFTNTLNGYYWIDYVLSFKVTYKSNGNNKYDLDLIDCRLSFNEKHEKNQSYNRRLVFQSILVFYDYQDKNNFSKEGKPNEESDMDNVMKADFNPEFWKEHENVFNEIPIEKNIKQSFMQKGFYGNLFPGGEKLKQ